MESRRKERKLCSLKSFSEKIFTRQLLKAIVLGQSLSFLICGTAVTSGLLQQNGVNVPTAQSFINYALLCIVYTTMLSCAKGEQNIVQVLKSRWWKYFLLALVDVEGNYLVVKAYSYTTVTSVQLLDCFTIPVVLLLSWIFLKARYGWIHIGGVGLCLLGVGSLVLADTLVNRYDGDGSQKLLGDMLCLMGATLYGISNVGQEFVVRNFNRVEFLGMMGLFGSVINGIQLAVLERQELTAIDFTSYKIWLLLLGFAACLFFLYSLMPVVMKFTNAAAVNLNLLSADFYSLLFGLFLFKYKFHFLYFISFGLILAGIIVYSVRPPGVKEPAADYKETDIQQEETQSLTQGDKVNRDPGTTDKGETAPTVRDNCSSAKLDVTESVTVHLDIRS